MPEYLSDQMPELLKLFPLEGAVLLPGGDLPLNIFEPRYLAMVRAAMKSDQMIGMIQPCPCQDKMPSAVRPFYSVGCAGKISSIEETPDGRFVINLIGIARFEILSHALNENGYREAQVDFRKYAHDFKEPKPLPECMTRSCLIEKFQQYLARHDMMVDWDQAAQIPDHRFYTLLAMICPFSAAEKQALLEAEDFEARCRLMKCMMDIACAEETLPPAEHLC